MTVKFFTALAICVGPLATWLTVGAFNVPQKERDRSWAQMTIFLLVCALLGDTWLIARYLL